MLNRCHERRALSSSCLLMSILLAFTATSATATELAGILVYPCDENGDALMRTAWHTSPSPEANIIGVAASLPKAGGSLNAPFLNLPDGSLDQALTPGTSILTGFMQYRWGEFPEHACLNLYFNGDDRNPGIAAITNATGPVYPGTILAFRRNTAPLLLSMDLREVSNYGDLSFTDDENRVVLNGFFFAHPNRPFVSVDRVGQHGLVPDGTPDAILVIQYEVAPQPTPNTAGSGTGVGPAPVVSVPMAIVGAPQDYGDRGAGEGIGGEDRGSDQPLAPAQPVSTSAPPTSAGTTATPFTPSAAVSTASVVPEFLITPTAGLNRTPGQASAPTRTPRPAGTPGITPGSPEAHSRIGD